MGVLMIIRFFMILYKVCGFSPQPETPIVVLDATTIYINDKRKRLIDSFEKSQNLSSNIDPGFYSKTEFQELLKDENNNLEKQWKTRVLFESTPRGNIVMFYDAYKQGFSYYSDSNSIPYNILNAVAMKYVLTYFCRDFFVDNEVTPEGKDSPLIKTHFTDDQKKVIENDTDTSDNKVFMKKLRSAPFAKLKNYSKSTDKKDEGDETIKPEYNRNRFICLGKMVNYKFLQSIDMKKNVGSLNGFSSKLLDNLDGETQVQKQVLNYKDFKRLQEKSNSVRNGSEGF